MSEKNILVIRAKRHISRQKLNEFQRLWDNQILKEGVIVIPDDFKFVSLNPETLKPCEFHWEQVKTESWWSKLLRRFKHE